MEPRQLVAAYFIIQAAATLAWWALLLVYPASIDWFHPTGWPAESLLSFWMADLILIVAGSVLTAICVWFRHHWASTIVWMIVAVTWYPTLVCIAISLRTGEAWIASSLMIIMADMSCVMASVHGNTMQTPATIRVTPMNRWEAMLWTIAQTVVFWATFLCVLPMGIAETQRYCGIDCFSHSNQSIASAVMFAAASCLGLWSGITMASDGGGTPLPTATAPCLVVSGPYRFVRNPMASAGILQGIAVGWYLGSVFVIAYSVAGAILWHIIARPVEERDLSARFGESYERYKQNVGLWIPSWANRT